MTSGAAPAFDSGIRLEPDAIVAASPRLTARWALGATRRTTRAVAGAAVALSTLRSDEFRLLTLADGQRTVTEIVGLSGLPANTALCVLGLLCQRGILMVVAPGTPPPAPGVGSSPAGARPHGHPSATLTPLFRVGAYEVALRLGQGGVATTYLCRRVASGGFQRLFTLKVIGQHADPQHAAAAFQREAQVGGLLDHPNIQRVVDVGTHQDQPFLVLDYIDGSPLADLMTDGRRLPPALALAVTADLLRALHHVHTAADNDGRPARLVHADVSPQNLLLGIDGVARLTDFGNAWCAAQDTDGGPGILAGKPRYMAPEQLCGEPLDARTDLFAVGVVLWEALTGHPLFNSDSYDSTFLKVMKMRIPAPSAFGAPPALDELCLRALCRTREGRFQTAREMARALAIAAADAGLSATPEDIRQRVVSACGESLLDRRRRAADAFRAGAPPATAPALPRQAPPAAPDDPFADAVSVASAGSGAPRIPRNPTEVLSAVRDLPPVPTLVRPLNRLLLIAAGLMVALSLGYWASAASRRESPSQDLPVPLAGPATSAQR